MFGLKLVSESEYQELCKKKELLDELAWTSRTINVWIRRNVDEGFLDKMTASKHEIKQVHKMRKLLAEHFNEPVEAFEPSAYVMKKALAGESL